LHYLCHYTSCDDIPTAQTISEAVGITYPYFTKIAYKLKRKGLIVSMQGRHGGYQVTKTAHETSVYDVILAVEGKFETSYISGEDTAECALQNYYKEIHEELVNRLSGKYIADFGTIW